MSKNISIDVNKLKYADSILSSCMKKASVLGIHNDRTRKVLTFFVQHGESKLEYLSDIRLMFDSGCDEDFTAGLEYDLFKKLVAKTGILQFHFNETHISIKTQSGNHRFKSAIMEYTPSTKKYSKEYQLFSTDLSKGLSHVFEPEYDPKKAGSFENDILFQFVGKQVIITTTDRNVLTRYKHTIQTADVTFTGEIVSLPANSMSFILNTLKDMNIFKLSIGENDIQIWISESRYNMNLKYNVSLSTTKFPIVDSLLICDKNTFQVNSSSLLSFVFNFVSVRNDFLQEIVKAKLNQERLEFNLIHRDHNSIDTIPVAVVQDDDVFIYIDMVLLRKTIKNIPQNVLLKVGLFEERCFISTLDDSFVSVVMGIRPEIISEIQNPPEETVIEFHEVNDE